MRERTLGILVVASLLLAACGGGGSPTAAPSQAAGSVTTETETSGATTGETSDGETTATETTAAGGSGTADACALATVDEVSAATGYTNIEVQPIPDANTEALSGCGYVSNGVLPAAIITILDPANTNTDPAGYLALPGSEEIQVSGARAVWMPAGGNVMMIIKGGTVASLLATPSQGSDPKAAAVKLVQTVADRL